VTPTNPSDLPAQQMPYPVPPDLTPAGRRALIELIRTYAVRLGNQLEIGPHQAHRTDREYTARDVHEAQQAYERWIREQADARDSDRRVLAAILLTVGSVGVGVTANFLHSAWQIAVFVLLAITGVAGLGLTWSSRQQR
jgi:hypothetical protein